MGLKTIFNFPYNCRKLRHKLKKKKEKKLNSKSRRVLEFSWTNGKLKPMVTQVGLSICYREKNDFDKFVKEP